MSCCHNILFRPRKISMRSIFEDHLTGVYRSELVSSPYRMLIYKQLEARHHFVQGKFSEKFSPSILILFQVFKLRFLMQSNSWIHHFVEQAMTQQGPVWVVGNNYSNTNPSSLVANTTFPDSGYFRPHFHLKLTHHFILNYQTGLICPPTSDKNWLIKETLVKKVNQTKYNTYQTCFWYVKKISAVLI